MPRMARRAAKRDANEAGIMEAMRRAGASVVQLSDKGLPDLIVGYLGVTLLVEIKTEKGKLTEDQITWHEEWRGYPVSIVRSIDDALALLASVL